MMKQLFFILFLFLLTTTTSAQSEKYADILFAEKSYDFGTFSEEKPVTHKFQFTNTGNAPLIIVQVKAGCGCTIVSFPKKPIKPGG
ncbi:MAG: DUF1573 domain-containing protein, partial [Bacteroidaceae bacterium]